MPKTLPGFLLVAGLILFVGSLFRGPLEYKSAKLPALGDKARLVVRLLGIAFLAISAGLYFLLATSSVSPDDFPLLEVMEPTAPEEPEAPVEDGGN